MTRILHVNVKENSNRNAVSSPADSLNLKYSLNAIHFP